MTRTIRPKRSGGGYRSTVARLSAVVAAAVALAVGTLTPALALATPLSQTPGDLEHLQMLSGQEFEIDFMSMMIQHHQMAVDMARPVVANGQHQELRNAAQKIIDDQTREIEEMKGWLKVWYNADPKAGMMHDMPGMNASDLMNLKGDELDKEFLLMMRMHHMGAIDMAKLALDRATHAELKSLAGNVINSQSAEIAQFESWLMTWYNVDAAAMGTPPSAEPGGAQPGMPSTGAAGENAGPAPLVLAALVALGALAAMGGGAILLAAASHSRSTKAS